MANEIESYNGSESSVANKIETANEGSNFDSK